LSLGLGLGWACDDDAGGSDCGPTEAVVDRVIDGDTIELEDGTRVRYLLVDAPEQGSCYFEEALQTNRSLVEGMTVRLTYDQVCTDNFGRLLAYVSVGGREVNLLLIERGAGCVLSIPPNGADREQDYDIAEARAEQADAGLWGACQERPC